VIIVIILIAAAYALFHAGAAHSNYRHGRAHGRRGISLYWSSARGPWISVPARSAPGSATASNPSPARSLPSEGNP